MKIRWMVQVLGLALVAAAGCGNEVCIDVIPNFTVRHVLYQWDKEHLLVLGHQSNSYCGDPDNDPQRYTQVLFDLAPEEDQFGTQERFASRVDGTLEEDLARFGVPSGAQALLTYGSFGELGCPDCRLDLKTRDGHYQLVFLTGGYQNDQVPVLLELFHWHDLLMRVDLAARKKV
jgi:hypothetical protein